MEIHDCHANGCPDNAHQEIPFCKRHFGMLPEPHRKALWAGRRKDGWCGACWVQMTSEPNERCADNWNDLYNLGVAIILVIEYDECGAPPEMHDAEGFCWGCGVDDAQKTYKTAEKVVKKFRLKAVA